ncbi:MAG TPA: acyl carrier protein [Terriglobia bacterium]|nr:acyl carrier protein [Terriglobia bacterium]
MPPIEAEIRQFVIDNFLFGAVDKLPSNDDSLLEQGIIDSTGVLEMVTFLEQKYGIVIDESELAPANLDSISRLVNFVIRKTAQPAISSRAS